MKNTFEGKKPYSNLKVYHPHGNLMFFSSKKKFNWYLRKNLAVKISDDSIQLTFEPKGYGEDPKYLTPRENICVVTGETDNLTKHHVIPTQFRQYFPMKYKSKNSADVVAITRDAHDEYEREADKLKEWLIDVYISEEEINYNKSLNYIQKMLKTINNYRESIPSDKIGDMYKDINGYLDNIKKINDDVIKLSHLDNLKPIDFNKLIVERIGVENMIKLWKNHFIEKANPKYLPEWWDPNDVKIVEKN
jgi:hypothetical protein